MQHCAVNSRRQSARQEVVKYRHNVGLVNVFLFEGRACLGVVVGNNRQERHAVGRATYRGLELRVNQRHVDNLAAVKTVDNDVGDFLGILVLRTFADAVIAFDDIVAALTEMRGRAPAHGDKFNAVNVIGVVVFAGNVDISARTAAALMTCRLCKAARRAHLPLLLDSALARRFDAFKRVEIFLVKVFVAVVVGRRIFFRAVVFNRVVRGLEDVA